ncbi:CPBP family intramembrane metalloprotease [Marinilabiliaceae bacterium JC017]|nr:CPBP family intramembrane metalloprotease [Marinilabiliaceae bacterium JC017]
MQTTHYNKPGLFYILSTLMPWSFWFLAAYISHLHEGYENQASIIAFLGLLFPALVVFAMTYQDQSIVNDIKKRLLFSKTVKAKFIIIGCILMPCSILLAQAISILFGYSTAQFQLSGQFSFSSGVFPVWFMLVVAPILEELAWHSYGTDCLRNRFNLFHTSMFFAFYWGIWHFPLSFINGYYHSNLAEDGIIYSINFAVSLIPFVIIMNWIYYKTGRNILITIIFHITAGLFNEMFQTHPMSKVIQTGLLLILCAYLLLSEKEFFFNKKVKR